MNRGIGAIVSLLAVVLLGGCITTSQRLEVTPKLEAAPAATKRPLHAGIYYSHDFLMQEHRRALGSHSAIAPIGQMSARMFDDLLSRLFRNTSRLSVVTEEEMRLKDIDVAVAVSLEHFDFRIGMDSDSDRYSVAYRITLYSPSGIPAASWVVLGNGPPIGGMMSGIEGYLEGDLTDAAVKFLGSFDRLADPALAALARNRLQPAPGPEARQITVSAKRSDLSKFKPELVQLFNKTGMQAIEVTVRSDAPAPWVVRASDMRLLLGSDYAAEPAAVSSVLTRMESAAPPGAGTVLLGPLFGTMVEVLEARERQSEQELRLREGGRAAFDDRVVAKDRDATGLVLFRASASGEYLKTARLAIWVVDPQSATGTRVEIPVSGLQ